MKRVVFILSGASTATMLSIVPTIGAGALAPSAACTAVPGEVTLVVPHDGGVALARSTGVEPLDVELPAMPSVAVRTPDGTAWAQIATGDETAEVYRVPAGGQPTLSTGGQVELSSSGALSGRAAAVIIDRQHPPGVEDYGAVIVEYADGEQVDVKHAGAPEYGVISVTVGTDRLVEGAWADLTEWFHYYGLDGEPADDWYSPTDAAVYGAPPFYQWPIAAPRGAAVLLSWVEGPDGDAQTNEIVGGWDLVVADGVTGAEALRLDLGRPLEATLLHADFDGRFWVGSFEPGGVVVVDTAADEPAAVDAGCATGLVATLDRLGAQTPTPAPPTTTLAAPATTTPQAPTTTTPVCPTYEPNDRYPIRLCDEGLAVRAVQQALAAAGHSLQVDGYFGPATEAEVRRFQQAHVLEVDGLVGDDTWAALVPFAPPAGNDRNASGVVDPWEIHQEPEPTGPDPLCPEFVTDEPRYPIRSCQVGFYVVAVQAQLDERAYNDYVNGFFDATTVAAVRAFQADAGLTVDGLVGQDTWAALYTGRPAGTDADGSGLIDPWELPIGDANAPESGG